MKPRYRPNEVEKLFSSDINEFDNLNNIEKLNLTNQMSKPIFTEMYNFSPK